MLAPKSISSVQPGGGVVVALELALGRLRRRLLRRFRKGYVARMETLRRGACVNCVHDIVDPRDLKFVHNVCGYSFDADRFAWRGRLGLARLGLGEVVLVGGGFAIVAIALAFSMPWLAPLPALLSFWAVAFFRDPERSIPDAPGVVVAPADGVVDDIEAVEHSEELGGPAWRVGIYLSLFNVHINRVPVAARVLSLDYCPGLRRATYRVGHTSDNEQLRSLFETQASPRRRLFVRQVAGPAARRIVCELRPGQDVGRGDRFGLIKFGSRTELWLPREAGVELRAQLGQRVRAGQSVLAHFTEDRP